MTDRTPVLVVGGGIAGLTLAVALHRQGVAAELVERSPSWPVEGAGITLHANGVRVLRDLGLGDAFERVSAPVPRWRFCDLEGRTLCETDLDALWGDAAPCRGVTRVRLQEVLVAAAAGVPSRLGVSVLAVDQDETGVDVRFSDRTRGRYRLVVGADGVGSSVRRLAVGPVEAVDGATTAWRSVATAGPDRVRQLVLLMGPGSFFGLVPVGDGQTYGFAGMASDRFDEPVDGRLDRLRRHFAGFGGPIPGYLGALRRDIDVHVARVAWLDLPTWHHGRVVLVGDAAHASPPHMGEGGAMAMEDALVLAELLAGADAAAPDGLAGMDALLAAWEARRRPRVTWVQEQSAATARAWLLPAEVRDAVLRERGDQLLQERYRPLVGRP